MFKLFFTVINIVIFGILCLLIISLNIKPCNDWNCINSFALWISAVGMVSISIITLWLTIKDKIIRIEGIFRLAIIPSDFTNRNKLNRTVFVLNFVNMGRRKAKITNFKICMKNSLFKNDYIFVFPQLDETLININPQFPMLLNEMDNKDMFFDENFFLNLDINKNNKNIFGENIFYAWIKIHTLYFILNTTNKSHIKIKVHKEASSKLWKQYKKFIR